MLQDADTVGDPLHGRARVAPLPEDVDHSGKHIGFYPAAWFQMRAASPSTVVLFVEPRPKVPLRLA
jgi:hypothetical protein